MAVQVQRVGGVQVRMRGPRPTPAITTDELVAYVVSGLVGILIGVQITGPLLVGLFLG